MLCFIRQSPPVRWRHDATRSGRPSASASRWILVVNPPRERPKASSSPPLLAPPLPVAACWWALTRVASSIRYSLLGSLMNSAKTRSQNARLCPAREALVHALPLAISLGQFVPLCPGSQHPMPAVDEQAIVLRGPTRVGL